MAVSVFPHILSLSVCVCEGNKNKILAVSRE